MKILLTNDDGITSPGLHAIRDAFQDDHEVWVVAPDGQRSGCSQSLTIHGSILTKEVGPREFSCSGTPVDCVNLAFSKLLSRPPDVVISGINLGANIGTDIGYSGTAAAARQGAYRDVPAIAISTFTHRPPYLYGSAVKFLKRYLETLVDHWSREFFYNVNTPNTDEEVSSVDVAEIAEAKYHAETISFDAPRGERYHFYEGELITEGVLEGTDLHTLLNGRIAVSYVRTVQGVTVAPGTPFFPAAAAVSS